MPPPVEPAQLPTNISSTSSQRDSSGQVLKSAVAKPVVLMTVATWKREKRRPCRKPPTWEAMFAAMTSTEPATIPR